MNLSLVCPAGTYGESCSNKCGIGCGGICHPVDGKCLPCIPGYQGILCDKSIIL